MGVLRAAPTSWVSRWDTGLVLPPASRSTSVTDEAASGATDALAKARTPLGSVGGISPSSLPSQTQLGLPGCVSYSITPTPDPAGTRWTCPPLHCPIPDQAGVCWMLPHPILQPVRACWMWPSVTPHPAGAHLQPLEPLQPSSWGKATVWGHHRRWDAGRTRGHALSHHPVTGTTLTPALSSAPWTGMGTAHPQPVRPQELEVSPSPSPTYLRPPCAPHGLARLQPYKAGAEPHAPQPPCVHRKSRSTLPLLTVNTSSGPARPWPPQCRGQVHPVPFSPKWGPPRSPRCPQPGHPAG